MGQSERSRDMATKVLLCALLGSAASKPVAEADLRFTRSAEAEAEAKAEPDAEALRPFAYSSPSGAVSFSLGGAAPSVASAAPLVSSSATIPLPQLLPLQHLSPPTNMLPRLPQCLPQVHLSQLTSQFQQLPTSQCWPHLKPGQRCCHSSHPPYCPHCEADRP